MKVDAGQCGRSCGGCCCCCCGDEREKVLLEVWVVVAAAQSGEERVEHSVASTEGKPNFSGILGRTEVLLLVVAAAMVAITAAPRSERKGGMDWRQNIAQLPQGTRPNTASVREVGGSGLCFPSHVLLLLSYNFNLFYLSLSIINY